MKNLTLENLTAACGGTLYGYDGQGDFRDKEATRVVIDSRLIEPGGIFIATRGERVDGHSFIGDVAKKGALGVICEEAPADCDIPYILVKNSFEALKSVAAFYRQQFAAKVIGITGSVGKTSTKEFIASVLSVRYRVCKTKGNFNNEVGLPLTILTVRDEDELAVVEMGISDFGEMTRLTNIAKPDTCVITNIGACHLENLKNLDGVLRAKTEIFTGMDPGGTVILNGDDPKLSSVTAPYGKAPVFFGTDQKLDVYAEDMESKGLLGSEATIRFRSDPKKKIRAVIPLPGGHMILNALAAATVGSEYGLSPEEIAEGIRSVQAVGGRSHVMKVGSLTVIDDCYNANPVSVRAAIDLLSTADTRRVALLGDMFELGADEEKLHRQIGEYASSKDTDVVIAIGKLARNLFDGAAKVGERHYYQTVEDFLVDLERVLKDGDTILVKASHGMHFERIVDRIKEIKNAEA